MELRPALEELKMSDVLEFDPDRDTDPPMGTIRTVRGRKAVYLYYASYGGGSGPL